MPNTSRCASLGQCLYVLQEGQIYSMNLLIDILNDPMVEALADLGPDNLVSQELESPMTQRLS